MSCVTEMNGQIKNTHVGGVTRVGKYLENIALLVGPTRLVSTDASVAVAPVDGIGVIIADEINPKYAMLASVGM